MISYTLLLVVVGVAVVDKFGLEGSRGSTIRYFLKRVVACVRTVAGHFAFWIGR